MNLDSVNKVYIKSLYRGYDDYIFDEEEIATIIDFLKSVKGTNKHSSKGYSGGVYSVALYDEGKCLLSIGFGSSNDFNYGENDKDKGYPNRYLLEGHTTDEIIVFFNQYVLLVD